MNNYRLNIYIDFDKDFNYWENFELCRKYYPMIRDIRQTIKCYGVEYVWFFFEPFIEITWINDSENEESIDYLYYAIRKVVDYYIEEKGWDEISHSEYLTPKNGKFADWYCKGDGDEMMFGAKRHHYCAELVMAFFEHHQSIKAGKGTVEQYKRIMHTLANPLALNFHTEGEAALAHGFNCRLIRYFPKWTHKWLLKKTLGQKDKVW